MIRTVGFSLLLVASSLYAASDSISVRNEFYSLLLKDEDFEQIRNSAMQKCLQDFSHLKNYGEILKEWYETVFDIDSLKLSAQSYIDSTLTNEDMKHIITFLKSDAGKKFEKMNKGLSDLFPEVMKQRIRHHLPLLHKKISQQRRNTLQHVKTPQFSGAMVEDPAGKYNFKFTEKKWDLMDTTISPYADFSFKYQKGVCYGVILSEESAMPADKVKEAAKYNLEKESKNFSVVKETAITVNDAPGYLLEMDAEIRGIPYTYIGYYFGGSGGAIQVLCWTNQESADDYKKDIIEFLDGMCAFVK